MIVKAAECPICSDIVYSRCEGDSNRCCCGFITISGSPDDPEIPVLFDKENLFDLEIKATSDDLFWDWNLNYNQYGAISEHLH
jgi:hypothetical protein